MSKNFNIFSKNEKKQEKIVKKISKKRKIKTHCGSVPFEKAETVHNAKVVLASTSEFSIFQFFVIARRS